MIDTDHGIDDGGIGFLFTRKHGAIRAFLIWPARSWPEDACVVYALVAGAKTRRGRRLPKKHGL